MEYRGELGRRTVDFARLKDQEEERKGKTRAVCTEKFPARAFEPCFDVIINLQALIQLRDAGWKPKVSSSQFGGL